MGVAVNSVRRGPDMVKLRRSLSSVLRRYVLPPQVLMTSNLSQESMRQAHSGCGLGTKTGLSRVLERLEKSCQTSQLVCVQACWKNEGRRNADDVTALTERVSCILSAWLLIRLLLAPAPARAAAVARSHAHLRLHSHSSWHRCCHMVDIYRPRVRGWPRSILMDDVLIPRKRAHER